MGDISILVVTSSSAAPSAVVPVLAAIEAAGMKLRAIDVGSAGMTGGGVADRMRRAIAGEGAERKLRREMEVSPPDAAIAFDPYSAIALTSARDSLLSSPVPVIAVVGELEPAQAWAQSDADRFLAVDDIAAVALADAGVEGDRILVVGAIGERAFADAATQDRTSLRTRFKLGGKSALVEVAGLGAEITGQLSLQLSLLDASSAITFLFDAGNDAEAAAVLRRQVPALGLKGKLFGATPDAPLLWRAADVIIARPRPEVISRVMLVGGKLVALIDDAIANGAHLAAALEARKRAISAKGLLMLSSALDSAFGGTPPSATDDGADQVADIIAAVASDKRGVIDERREAASAATRDRVHRATTAAQTAAAQTAAAGDLEDLGGGGSSFADAVADLPDKAELEHLRNEVARRSSELSKQMTASRDAANDATDKAKGARARGADDEATQLERKADAERARMHSMLAELATLEREIKDLEASIKSLGDMPRTPPPSSASSSSSGSSASSSYPPPRQAPPRVTSIDDELQRLKRQGGGAPGPGPRPTGSSVPTSGGSAPKSARKDANVDDELAALKKKMQGAPPTPPKKK